MRKRTSRQAGEFVPPRQMWQYLAWLALAAGWLMSAAALLSYDPSDWPSPFVAPHNEPATNWAGQVGAWVAHELYSMIGPGVWLMMAGGLALMVALALRRPVTQPIVRAIGLLIMSLSASALIGLAAPSMADNPIGTGGLIAVYANRKLILLFNYFGSLLVLLGLFWLGAIVAMDQVLTLCGRWMVQGGRFVASHVRWPRIPRPVLVGKWPKLGMLGPASSSSGSGKTTRYDATATKVPVRASGRLIDSDEIDEPDVEAYDDEQISPDAGGLGATHSFGLKGKDDRPGLAVIDDVDEDVDDSEAADDSDDGDAAIDADSEAADVIDADEDHEDDKGEDPTPPAADAPGAYTAARKQFTPEELRAKIKQLPISFASRSGVIKTPPPREVDLSGYRFPEISLLEDPESTFTTDMERIVRDQAVQLESALQQYRIAGEVVGIDSGPVITLFEVRLAPGTKVAQVNAISSDLARALKSHSIRVVANMAGKDTVGVEVPNLKKEKVRLKELMTGNNDAATRMKLPMWLGKDASGHALTADLTTMPHMLIAGTTGSGKSVCINSIIMSFLFTKRPDELKLVLIDPKMVELSAFRDIPHLMCPVVTEMSKASAILEWATTKMDERYELLAEAAVRDIAGYNDLTWEQITERMEPKSEAEEARIPRKLPYLVFIIDELADLMMTNKETEGFIVRLAQKSRAVGLHLILATQRPQANVVTGLIKSNMPCRVSFKVASGMDSRIVLDSKGAELLLGQGDMLYLSPRTSKLTRAQGTLVGDAEIRRCARFLKTVAEPSFEPQLVQIKGPNLDAELERDPLFDEAVSIVLESGRGSVSLLQRRLTIGYSRASRLIEEMAATGILGDYKGSQARQVMIGQEEWEALRAQAEADAIAAAEQEEVQLLVEQEETLVEDDDEQTDAPKEMPEKTAEAGQQVEELEETDKDEADGAEEEKLDGDYVYDYDDSELIDATKTDEEDDDDNGDEEDAEKPR